MPSSDPLNELKHRIDKAKGKEEESSPPVSDAGPFRISLELVSGVFVGGGAGYFLDRWIGTSPLFLLVLGAVGTVAGFLNIYRLAKSEKPGHKSGASDQ